jgi:mannose/fructose/N-acetylgalactosamine-specific phosphotransferase system component IIC
VLLPSFDASQASVATGGIAGTAVSVGQQQQQQQQQPAAAATAAPILFLPVEGQLLRRFSAQMRMGLRDLHAVVSASPRRRSTDKARALN